MKHLLPLLVMGFVLSATAQYSEIDHSERAVYLGVNGVDDTQTTSATLVLPFDAERAQGWFGAYVLHSTANGEVISDQHNLHVESGIKTNREGLTLNVFVDQSADKERGIDKQRQVGLFVRQVVQTKRSPVTVGFGNFAEAGSVRADLGLKETDDVLLSRWLAYMATEVGGLDILIEFTPAYDFRDQQVTLEPRYAMDLADNLALVVSSIVELDSHPVVEDKYVSASYQLQLSARW